MPSFSRDSDTEFTTTESVDTRTACRSQLFMFPPRGSFRGVRGFLLWNDYQRLQNRRSLFVSVPGRVWGKGAHFISLFTWSRIQVECNRTVMAGRRSHIERLNDRHHHDANVQYRLSGSGLVRLGVQIHSYSE